MVMIINAEQEQKQLHLLLFMPQGINLNYR